LSKGSFPIEEVTVAEGDVILAEDEVALASDVILEEVERLDVVESVVGRLITEVKGEREGLQREKRSISVLLHRLLGRQREGERQRITHCIGLMTINPALSNDPPQR
jgi:hypothetical protein